MTALAIALIVAACAVVGGGACFVALRLGMAFIGWLTAHEERRASDVLAKRVTALEAVRDEHAAELVKLKAENRAAAISKLGGR